ncbi:hypothetical protein LPJ81_005043 [Coemansia sp. IMI 209127]|nr:hypothetical protein LPJ81_005043 [Coemansia sp. IMI 209127]
MQASAALARSAWVQFAVDCIPSSIQAGEQSTQHISEQKYYTMLEIYRANIEKQIEDPSTVLPVKRAMLRVLMVLCEGVDPADEGFSAMTTAEVSHRLQETVRRFWNGPAIKGTATTAVSKLATILNSLLVFSSTALEESEASTDAFAVAAGARVIGNTGARSGGVDPSGGSGQDVECATRSIGDDGDQVQFVTNATACLAIYIKDTIAGSRLFGCHTSPGLPFAFSHRCAGLADALATLNDSTLLKFVQTFASSLLALDVARLSAAGKSADKPLEHSQQQQTAEPQTLLEKRVSAIVKLSHPADVSRLLDTSLVSESLVESDEMDIDTPVASGSGDVLGKSSFNDFAIRGAALTRLTQQLVSSLCQSASSGSANDASAQVQQQQSPPSVVSSKSIVAGGLLSTLRDFSCGILGQLQAIAVHINPHVAELLSLTLASRSSDQSRSSSFSPIQPTSYVDAESVSGNEPALGPHGRQHDSQTRSNMQDMRMRLAIHRRLQIAQPLCHLMREYPEEFGVGEWLMTLVALCLSPACQPPLSSAQGVQSGGRSGKRGPEGSPGDLPGCEFYQYLLDFTAVVSESITSSTRKHTLELLRLVSPIARSAACNHMYADMLGRLFPFDISIASTRGIQPLPSSAPAGALDNPWVWLESLEFVPLAPLNSSSIPIGGLEGMTPFTLRGMLERENAISSEKASGARGGGAAATGYLANLRFNTARAAGPDRNSRGTNSVRRSQVASVRRLQYLENPYFPMQPAFLFPLAETAIPWHLFGGKRRRMDSETRLVWRAQCESAFGSSD